MVAVLVLGFFVFVCSSGVFFFVVCLFSGVAGVSFGWFVVVVLLVLFFFSLYGFLLRFLS